MTEISRPLLLARTAAWLGAQLAFGSPRHTARLLYGFARTEAQSRLELCRAAQLCEDAERRALYLRHSLDEERHALAFADHAARLSLAAGGKETIGAAAGSEDWFERFGEARFLALVHRGETRGRVQFEVYARLLRKRGQALLAQLFEQIVQDERQHEAYSARVLQDLVGLAEARRALGWAARVETWRTFRRHGRRLGGLLYALSMLLVYVALTPYALVFRLLSRPRRGLSNEA
jgi:hypothetical protein